MDSPLKIEKALPRAKGKGKEEGGLEEGDEAPATPKPTTNTSKKGGNKKRTRPQGSVVQTEGFQPDPRWADELAKLKEMLAASSSN